MLTAGVDVGAATAKTAIVRDGEMIAHKVIPTGSKVQESALKVTEDALAIAGLTMSDLDAIISTGYARHVVSFSNRGVSEIICHAKGVHHLIPDARTIIDIGGQDSKVIGPREDGTVADFVMNDKCAAGTGRFLEVMANVLELTIDEMGPEALLSHAPATVTSTCTIFAESEMISLRAENVNREDIVAGIHRAVARRVIIMGKTVGYKDKIVFTGGVAKNIGIKYFLEKELGMEVVVGDEPQIMGALGAALIAQIAPK
ncbi:MAG: 2-hydroxyglutaryl-CoA dehydratase [Chloroflexi bacterium]|nr:2-hydroxyglutaryl-CoA dehydratase [Chloroflexota bacterium]